MLTFLQTFLLFLSTFSSFIFGGLQCWLHWTHFISLSLLTPPPPLLLLLCSWQHLSVSSSTSSFLFLYSWHNCKKIESIWSPFPPSLLQHPLPPRQHSHSPLSVLCQWQPSPHNSFTISCYHNHLLRTKRLPGCCFLTSSYVEIGALHLMHYNSPY